MSGCSLMRHLREFLAQRVPDLREQLGILRRLAQLHGIARPREVDLEVGLHAARPRRHQDDAVGQGQRLAEIVGDEQHGLALALPQAQQHRVHVELGVGVERAERLVHQEDFGSGNQRAHQRHALAHAARQRGGIEAAEAVEAGLVDRLVDARACAPRPARRQARARSRCCPRRCARETACPSGRRSRRCGSAGRARPAESSTRMSPPLGVIRVATMLRMVLLPQPEGPSRATNSPSLMRNEASSTATTSRPSARKILRSLSISMRQRSAPQAGYLACAALRNLSATASSSLIGCVIPVSSLYQTFSPRA